MSTTTKRSSARQARQKRKHPTKDERDDKEGLSGAGLTRNNRYLSVGITFMPVQNSAAARRRGGQGPPTNPGIEVAEEDIQRLKDRDAYLNDVDMNVGLQRIWESLPAPARDGIALLGADWLKVRVAAGREQALRWASPGALAKPFAMGLVSDGRAHWSAFFVVARRLVIHVDSLGRFHDSERMLGGLLDLLRAEDEAEVRLVRLQRGTPQQPNCVDCGPFALTAIERFCQTVSEVGDSETAARSVMALVPWLENDHARYPEAQCSILGRRFLTRDWFDPEEDGVAHRRVLLDHLESLAQHVSA